MNSLKILLLTLLFVSCSSQSQTSSQAAQKAELLSSRLNSSNSSHTNTKVVNFSREQQSSLDATTSQVKQEMRAGRDAMNERLNKATRNLLGGGQSSSSGSGFSMVTFRCEAASWFLYSYSIEDQYGHIIESWNGAKGVSKSESESIHTDGEYTFKVTVVKGSEDGLLLYGKMKNIEDSKTYSGTLNLSGGDRVTISSDWSGVQIRR